MLLGFRGVIFLSCFLLCATVTDFAKQTVFAHLNTHLFVRRHLAWPRTIWFIFPSNLVPCEHRKTSARVCPHQEFDPGGLSPRVSSFLVSRSCLFDSLALSKASRGSLPDARLDQWTRDGWSWIVMFASLRSGTHTVAGRINGNFAAWR